MIEKKQIHISDIGVVTPIERQQVLSWISRCIASVRRTIQTPEGINIWLSYPESSQYTTLYCEDGELELINYELTFKVTNSNEWDEILKYSDKNE